MARPARPLDLTLGIMINFGSSFVVLRETVGQLDPREPTARARVILRRQSFGGVKTANRNVDLVRGVLLLENQLRTAVRTEAPHAICG